MLHWERFHFIDELVFLFKVFPALILRSASILCLSALTACWCVCRSFSWGMHFWTKKWFYWINNRWPQAATVEAWFLRGYRLKFGACLKLGYHDPWQSDISQPLRCLKCYHFIRSLCNPTEAIKLWNNAANVFSDLRVEMWLWCLKVAFGGRSMKGKSKDF